MNAATARIEVSHQEPFVDATGQRWSPADIVVSGPPTNAFPAPSIAVKVVAVAEAGISRQDLEKAHLQAAHDVLTAALLGIEAMIETSERHGGSQGDSEASGRDDGGGSGSHACPRCGSAMKLIRREPYPAAKPEGEWRTFRCALCGHSEAQIRRCDEGTPPTLWP